MHAVAYSTGLFVLSYLHRERVIVDSRKGCENNSCHVSPRVTYLHVTWFPKGVSLPSTVKGIMPE